jgi:UDP-N-acetylglucosamine--N-acetylmuramyl-(pentapeptide) pyrophosphoryl-undecaprenol N-acetylglucosamine transferase
MILTGNPVRQDLIDIESKRVAAIEYFNLDATKKTLLVLGGSLGARRVNQLIEKELESIQNQMFRYGNVGSYILRSIKKYNSTKSSLLSKEWILYMHLLIIIQRDISRN